MKFRGNTCIIGWEKIFALDLGREFFNQALENQDLCVFLGNDSLFQMIDCKNKENVILYKKGNFKLKELHKDCEDGRIYIIVTSDWLKSNITRLKKKEKELIRILNEDKYKALVYYNIIDLGIEELEETATLFFDEIVFDNKNKIQIMDMEEISNIRFLLKSIRKAKLDNLDLEKNKKNLQILNDSIISFSFENNLEEVIQKTLKTSLSITNADYGSITILYNNQKIEKEYSQSHIDLTYSYRIYSKEEIVGILTLGYKEEFYKGKDDDYIIDIICSSLGDIIYTFKEREEGQFLQSSNNRARFMGEIAGGIVHDLNNVFAIIKGYTQLLSINKEAYNIKEYLNIISDVTKEAIEKVKTIQDFSRNIKEDKKHSSINDIIEKAVETTRPKWENMGYINGRNIHVVLNLDSEKNVFIQEAEIRECIINMILNAVDSMVYGGSIYIRSYDYDGYAVVEIMDEGIGIDEGIIKSIFNPFFTTKEKSTGLGLSIAKKNIESNEGTIEVESIKGRMTKFRIKLPIREENAACYV